MTSGCCAESVEDEVDPVITKCMNQEEAVYTLSNSPSVPNIALTTDADVENQIMFEGEPSEEDGVMTAMFGGGPPPKDGAFSEQKSVHYSDPEPDQVSTARGSRPSPRPDMPAPDGMARDGLLSNADNELRTAPSWINSKMLMHAKRARRQVKIRNEQAHILSAARSMWLHRQATERSIVRSRSYWGQVVKIRCDAYKARAWRTFEIIVSAVAGCTLTFYLNHDVGFFSVLASSLVGVLAHNLPSPCREVAFAGTFGGMGGHLRVPGGPLTLGSSAALGFVIGVVFILMESIFNGVGGKLGTIAFISGVLCAAIGKPLGNEWKAFQDPAWDKFTVALGIEVVVAGTIGCLFTVILLNKTPPVASTTLASATVGLLSLSVLQLDDDPFYGKMWSAFAYTGSFAGMSAKTRLQPPWVVLAGFLGSCILLLLWPICPGVGGKYGLSALLAVLIVERIPGATNSKYDPKTWFAKEPKEELVAAGVSPKSRLADIIAKIDDTRQPDWVDWIPRRAWMVIFDYLDAKFKIQKEDLETTLTSGMLKTMSNSDISNHSLPISKEVRIAQRAFSKHYGLDAPRIGAHHVGKVRKLLDLCCLAERKLVPPPDLHVDGENDPTSVWAAQWFYAVARKGEVLPENEAMELLEALDAQGVGLKKEVDVGEFARCVHARRERRRELFNLEREISGGFYS